MAEPADSKSPPFLGPLEAFFRRLTGRTGELKVSTRVVRAAAAANTDEAEAQASGDVVEPLPTLELGAQRFADQGVFARGGMAEIHRLFDCHIQREVAMKRLLHVDDDERLRFLEEAQITGQLEHPNIVPIHDLRSGDDQEPDAILMKLIDGETLAELLSRYTDNRGPSDRELEALLQIFLKVCDAVAFAHSKGVIHRDIKPENVMVGSFGQVYVMDWGLSKLLAGKRISDAGERRVSLSSPPHQEKRGELYGTPAYMAVEQAFGDVDSVDERTDVFGLGGLLYEILTQKPPHQSTQSLIRGAVPQPQEVVGERPLPARLCAIAMRALEPDQDDRFQSVAELREAVEEFIREGGWFSVTHFKPGEDIVREGERGQKAYIIDEGTCEVWHDLGGEREIARTLGPGEPFGEAALFSDMPRTATVTAVTDVRVAVITRESLDRELRNHAWLRSLIKAVATRFVETDRELRNERSGRFRSD